MKKIYSCTLLAMLWFTAAPSLHAGAFADKGFSSRAAAIGNSYAALSNDPSGIFYNPAGLFELSGIRVQTSYARLFPGVEDDNLNLITGGATYRIEGLGTVGLGVTSFNTKIWNEIEYAGAYAMSPLEDLSVGGTVRFLHWSAPPPPGEGSYSYSGLTFNAGILYAFHNVLGEETGDKANILRFGATLHNINRPSVSKNGSDDARLPFVIETGTAYISNRYDYLVTASYRISGGESSYGVGTEFLAFKVSMMDDEARLCFRLGGDRSTKKNVHGEYTAGFGLTWSGMSVDYVYLYPTELVDLGGTQRITLQYNF